MGTRADLYVGRGSEAEWLGSVAWDGYPDGVFANDSQPDLIDKAPLDEQSWRTSVATFLGQRGDSTLPERGWPWPWEDSNATDYAYAFDGGQVWGNSFGHGWFLVSEGEVRDEEGNRTGKDEKPTAFPNMVARQNVRWDRGSGLVVLG